MKSLSHLTILLTFALTLAACTGESDEPVTLDDEDAGHNGDEEDVLSVGDVTQSNQSDRRCGDAIINEWPLNDAVTGGAVDGNEDDGVWELTVDAAAGGMSGAANNPFVYLRLDTAERVDITDIDSLDDEGWDLAFRRTALRTNSGDSGPGSVSVAKEVNTTFDDVTAAPGAANRYETDVSLEENCDPMVDSIGNLFTAFNHLNVNNPSGSQSWYDYGSGGGMGVEPVAGDIYVVRIDDRDETYRFEILDWDSGVYTIRFAPLASPVQ
jgi:hypothetical protein